MLGKAQFFVPPKMYPEPSNVTVSLNGGNNYYKLTASTITVGRSSKCDFVIDSKSVSSVHARLLFNGPSDSVLIDLNSRNGTFVNDVHFRNKDTPITHGDIVRFGYDVASYRIEFPGCPTLAAFTPAEYVGPQDHDMAEELKPSTSDEPRLQHSPQSQTECAEETLQRAGPTETVVHAVAHSQGPAQIPVQDPVQSMQRSAASESEAPMSAPPVASSSTVEAAGLPDALIMVLKAIIRDIDDASDRIGGANAAMKTVQPIIDGLQGSLANHERSLPSSTSSEQTIRDLVHRYSGFMVLLARVYRGFTAQEASAQTQAALSADLQKRLLSIRDDINAKKTGSSVLSMAAELNELRGTVNAVSLARPRERTCIRVQSPSADLLARIEDYKSAINLLKGDFSSIVQRLSTKPSSGEQLASHLSDMLAQAKLREISLLRSLYALHKQLNDAVRTVGILEQRLSEGKVQIEYLVSETGRAPLPQTYFSSNAITAPLVGCAALQPPAFDIFAVRESEYQDMTQQLESLRVENSKLTNRNSDLEDKLREKTDKASAQEYAAERLRYEEVVSVLLARIDELEGRANGRVVPLHA